jgi:hypothetical protein
VSKRTATWLAWSMCALSLVLTALSLLLLLVQTLSYPDVLIFAHWLDGTLAAISLSTVGAVIASRSLPNNPIGWLFCTLGLVYAVDNFSAQYAIFTLLATPGSLPAGYAAAWIFSWLPIPQLGLVAFVLLVFPSGRLPSPRWRWFFWLSLLLTLVGTIWQMFDPGPVFYLGGIYNPLGVEGLPNLRRLIQTLLYAVILASAASLFVRRVRARGVERQQLMWVTYSTTLAVIGLILTFSISELTGSVWLGWAGYVVLLVGLIGIPISMGIAITRYRLYEIDLVINRTLVYGSLTGLLALLYFGSVTTLQYLFSLLTGQGNTIAIVATTLAIAALFNPLRRRIQSVIDRSFYRRKYDAAKTLEEFAAKLRDETDLQRISEDLVEVVDETMQPSHVSLWLSSFPSSSPNSSESSSNSEVRRRSSSSKQGAPPSH